MLRNSKYCRLIQSAGMTRGLQTFSTHGTETATRWLLNR